MELQVGIRSVGQGCTATVDAYTNTADQVAHADSDPSPEQRVTGEVVVSRVEQFGISNLIHLRGEDDGHDNAVDGDDFAEDDRDQVLGSYPWCLNTSAEDGHSGCPDAPSHLSAEAHSFPHEDHTMPSLRQTGQCTARFLHSPMCMVIRFRERRRPADEASE